MTEALKDMVKAEILQGKTTCLFYEVSEKRFETNLQAIWIAVSLSMTVIGA